MNTQFKHTSHSSLIQQPRFKRALLAAVVISSCGLSVSSWAADTASAPVAAPASVPQVDRDAPRPEWTAEQRAQFKAKREQERTARKTEFYKQLDKNQDGQVTLAEWLAFQPEHDRGEGRFGEGRDEHDGGHHHRPQPDGDFHPQATAPDGRPVPDTPEARRTAHQAEWLQRVDTNHDGQISKAEAESNAPWLAERFKEIDSNHDGVISPAELQAFHAAKVAKWHEQILKHRTKVFEQADANHDGKLTLQEWLAYQPHHHGFWHRLWSGLFGHHHPDRGDGRGEDRSDHGGPRGEGFFKHLDSNSDGQISLSEAQANDPRLAAHFNEIDTDHNGQISQDELRAFFSARHAQSQ